jgi:transposase-like protein
MATHRRHSLEFKRQVVQEYLAGETLHGLAKRHDLARNLIRLWVQKYEAGAFDDERAGGGPDPSLRGADRGARVARGSAHGALCSSSAASGASPAL